MFITSDFSGQDDRAGEEEDQRARRQREDRERPRQVRAEDGLLVDEARRLARDTGRGQLGSHSCGRAAASRSASPLSRGSDVEPPEAGRDLAGGQHGGDAGRRREPGDRPPPGAGRRVIAVIGA